MDIQEHESLVNGLVPISFADGEFSGIRFTIGKVNLIEKDSKLVINFDLDILDDISYKKYDTFKTMVGDYILLQMDEGNIIFSNGTGGTFEN